MDLTSPAFRRGDPIPLKYTADGNDVSPPLVWDDVPDSTAEFALLCDDPDAPTPEPWVHWVLYKIASTTRSLAAGIPAVHQGEGVPGLQGENSWKSGRTVGYRGPAPPRGHGMHHYRFQLFALSKPIPLPPQADKEALLAAMKGHILAQAELVGTYER